LRQEKSACKTANDGIFSVRTVCIGNKLDRIYFFPVIRIFAKVLGDLCRICPEPCFGRTTISELAANHPATTPQKPACPAQILIVDSWNEGGCANGCPVKKVGAGGG
jgi:hypothetical protein